MLYLIRPASFLFIMFAAFFMKEAGLFKKDLSLILLKIIMNVTLPAVIIASFGSRQMDLSACLLIPIGLLGALVPYLIMYILTGRSEKEERICYMISASGFNIGCYGMPIISAFFGPATVTSIALFDLGNSLMMTSGNYAFTSVLLKTDENEMPIRVSDLLRRFFSSVPIWCYLIMLLLQFGHILLPETLLDFISPMANANAFLSMFLLGLLFSPPREKSDFRAAVHILGFRFAFLGAAAFLLYHVLPVSLELRQIVVLLLLCPIGAMAPAFVEKCHGDGEAAAFVNSVSTVSSLILMTFLAGLFTR